MRSGYYHIVILEKSRLKMVFVSWYGKWEFKRCSFGLGQTPAYFQRLVNEVLSGFTFAFGYLDGILVFSPYMKLHLEHPFEFLFESLRITDLKLKEVKCNFLKRHILESLRITDLKLKEVKCNFLKRHIQYLGHIVSGEGITPLPEKLDSIQKNATT